MKRGDIVKVKERDGTYEFYRVVGRRNGSDMLVIESKDGSPPKSVLLDVVSLASERELFNAYESVCQRLKETEAARQVLGYEYVEMVNSVQTHLRSPF